MRASAVSGMSGRVRALRAAKSRWSRRWLHAAQEGLEPVEHRETLARRLDDQRVRARALPVRDQERGLAGGAVARAQVVEVAGVDAAARDAVVHDRAERGLRVAHEHREARSAW